MLNLKITRDRANKIRDAILAGRFDKRRDALLDRWARLAQDAYELKYSKKIRTQMYELPDGWLPERSDINVAFGEASEDYICLNFNGICYCTGLQRLIGTPPAKRENVMRRFLDREWRNPINPEATSPIGKSYRALREATAALEKENAELANEIEQAIYGSGSTVKALVGRWPEVESVVVPLFGTQTVAPLPAPILTDLNKKLGLKKAA